MIQSSGPAIRKRTRKGLNLGSTFLPVNAWSSPGQQRFHVPNCRPNRARAFQNGEVCQTCKVRAKVTVVARMLAKFYTSNASFTMVHSLFESGMLVPNGQYNSFYLQNFQTHPILVVQPKVHSFVLSFSVSLSLSLSLSLSFSLSQFFRPVKSSHWFCALLVDLS